MKNKLTDLRDHLFATLEALQDEEKPMDINRAKAIADVARVLVDSAKVEVAFIQAMDGDVASSGFIESQKSLPSPSTGVPGQPALTHSR